MKKAIAAGLALICLSFPCGGASFAGPFGTEMGDAPEKFKDLKRVNNLYYEAVDIPRAHSRISHYLLGFSKTGLSRLIGYTQFDNDYEGARALSLYRLLHKTLAEKYGEPSATGGNMSGAIWTKGMCVWDKDLPHNLKSVTLAAYSPDGVKSRVDVFYVYKNNPTPEEWEELDREAL